MRESENFWNSREIEAERRNCRKAETKGGSRAKVAVGNERLGKLPVGISREENIRRWMRKPEEESNTTLPHEECERGDGTEESVQEEMKFLNPKTGEMRKDD
jgi:hypothetical protein